MSSNKLMGLFATIVVGTLVLEVVAATSRDLSALETTLFSILQFVFSIALAWVMARDSSQRDFEAQQRRFAVSAYRRIREIERATERLMHRLRSALSGSGADLAREIDVAQSIAHSISETAQSSKSDWANVIGEEISTVREIESLRTEQQRLTSATGTQEGEQGTSDRLSQIEVRLNELRQSLDASLRVDLEEEDDDESPLSELDEMLADRGHLELEMFAEPDMGFQRSVSDLTIGEELILSIQDIGNRIGTIVAEDKQARTVGSLINPTESGSYADSTLAVFDIIGASRFAATVVMRDEKPRIRDRSYFTVAATPVRSAEDRWAYWNRGSRRKAGRFSETVT